MNSEPVDNSEVVHSLFGTKKEVINNREIYGVDIGDVYYHYETIGSVYWGMKKFTIKKVGTGCMCYTPFYVELEFTNNDGEISCHHVSSEELVKDFSVTEKEA